LAKKLPAAFLKRLATVTGQRARIVVEHILEHGHITTEDLSDEYGYDHPPRAIRDVREQGIPLDKFNAVGKHGRRIAGYRFAESSELRGSRHAGRQILSKKLKRELIEHHGARCAICSCDYEARYLQIDHRVPYEVAGDVRSAPMPPDFMLICGSCNRAKSWSCEHCPNWTTDHDSVVCKSCYWASPNKYVHIALRAVRRLDIVWTDEEVPDYEKLAGMAKRADVELPTFVKEVLRRRTRAID
jgi:hypothetical protein